MERKWIVTGLVLLISGIVLGAFGAHALKDLLLNPEQATLSGYRAGVEKLNAFETGVRYQLIHALGFMIVPFIASYFGVNSKWSFRLLLSGVICFSLSIYMLTIKDVAGVPAFKFFGPVTPIGGLLMILGWTVLLMSIVRKR